MIRPLVFASLFLPLFLSAHTALAQSSSRSRTLIIGVLSYESGESTAPDSVSRNAERGLEMGLEEARKTSRLFGRDVKQSRIVLRPGSDARKAARIMARTTNMAGLLVTNPELVPAADSMAALGYAVIVFHTLPSADDYCSRFTFSIYPPKPDLDSVSNAFRKGHRAPAVAFDAGASLDSTPRVALWSPALERFGALELNDRFRARWKTGMTSEAWASWVAVKILSEAALRKQSTEPFALLAYLSASEFDGHKGWPLTFRSADHVMRQPLYIVLAGRRDIVAELPSGGRSETESAETVLDRVLPRRPNASCKGQ